MNSRLLVLPFRAVGTGVSSLGRVPVWRQSYSSLLLSCHPGPPPVDTIRLSPNATQRCHPVSRCISTTVLYRAAPTTIEPPPQAESLPIDTLGTSAHDMWAADAAATLAEGETFASLGLGGYSPVGLLQSSMELVHNATGLPWWGTIVISTLCIRALFLPINILMQRNTVKLHNVNPEVEKFKKKQQIYILAGNAEMALVERSKMNAVFKEHGIRPFLSALPMLFQGVFLVSFFLAIRGMANAPVATMMAGGALWFPDLTIPDPSFLLPMISCGGFMISMEVWHWNLFSLYRASKSKETTIIIIIRPPLYEGHLGKQSKEIDHPTSLCRTSSLNRPP